MADQNQRQLNQDIGQKRIAHGHVDVPQTALSIKERGQSPVGHAQHQEREQQ